MSTERRLTDDEREIVGRHYDAAMKEASRAEDRLRRRGVTSDLVFLADAATYGLMLAAATWDPAKTEKFWNYAKHLIRFQLVEVMRRCAQSKNRAYLGVFSLPENHFALRSDPPCRGAEPHDLLAGNEIAEKLMDAVSPGMQSIAQAVWIDGTSRAEIATATNTNRMKISRALIAEAKAVRSRYHELTEQNQCDS